VQQCKTFQFCVCFFFFFMFYTHIGWPDAREVASQIHPRGPLLSSLSAPLLSALSSVLPLCSLICALLSTHLCAHFRATPTMSVLCYGAQKHHFCFSAAPGTVCKLFWLSLFFLLIWSQFLFCHASLTPYPLSPLSL
jgi:hypothetical protein